MAEIVNLRAFAKQKKRHAKADKAARNRAAFGRGKADKALDSFALERQRTELDGNKLTPDGDSDGGE